MEPRLTDYFEEGSAWKLLMRRHPYDFVETYELLRSAYGYHSHYVNLGLWNENLVLGSEELDPAERLVKLLCEKAELPALGEILDVGSGLGQSAVHYVQWLRARRVRGLNLNQRQLSFAKSLARFHKLEDKISHHRLDACGGFEEEFGENTIDGVFAVECMGHFARPEAFIQSVKKVLRVGGKFVFCLNVRKASFSLLLSTMFRATYGFVPKPLSFWTEGLERNGLRVTGTGDISQDVLGKGSLQVLCRLKNPVIRGELPSLPVWMVEKQLSLVLKGVNAGELGYFWVSATKA